MRLPAVLPARPPGEEGAGLQPTSLQSEAREWGGKSERPGRTHGGKAFKGNKHFPRSAKGAARERGRQRLAPGVSPGKRLEIRALEEGGRNPRE